MSFILFTLWVKFAVNDIEKLPRKIWIVNIDQLAIDENMQKIAEKGENAHEAHFRFL